MRHIDLIRRHWRLPLLVFCLALLPRVVFLVELRANAPTFDRPEGGDSIFYDRVASGEPTPARAYFHSPLYQWFLRGVYGVFGRDLVVVRLIQHVLGAVTAVLLFFLVRRLLGSDWLGVAAALLAAWFGPGVFYEGQLLVDALLPLLTVACALAFVSLTDRPTLRLAFGLGLLLGLAALGRATVLIWLPLAMGWLIYRRRHWWHAAAVCGGVVVMVLPVTVRNYVVEKDLVAITSNGGINLYIGNNPHARGTYNLPEGLWFRPGDPLDDFAGVEVGRVAFGRVPSSSELSGWWTRRALGHMRAHPRRTAVLTVHKAALLWDSYEQPQLYNFDAYRELSRTLRVLPGAGAALALGLVGLLLLCTPLGNARLRRYALLPALLALAYLPFFVAGRYRAPLVVLLCPLAVWSLALLVDALRNRRWRLTGVLGLTTALAAGLTYYPVGPRPNRAQQYYAFGVAAEGLGHHRAAAQWYRKAVHHQPARADAHAALARVHLRAGRPHRAYQLLRRARARFPTQGEVLRTSAEVHATLGRPGRAEALLRQAIARDPASFESWELLARVAWRRGRLEAASQAFRSALVLVDRQDHLTRWRLSVALVVIRLQRRANGTLDPR